MLNEVSAGRFLKVMSSGRNKPCLIECEDVEGKKVELVVKYSASLIEREKNLAIEAIVSMLAADLGLPIPEPFIVELSQEFIEVIDDVTVKMALKQSCRLAFGSALQTGFAAWLNGQKIPKNCSQSATEIAIFDQIIMNSDRRPINPNCLFFGDAFRIIDHELAFTTILFRKEPWENGGLADLSKRDQHIFALPYYDFPMPTDYGRFIAAWKALTDTRFLQYKNALPPAWLYDENHIDCILNYLKKCRDQIGTIIKHALQVLK